jgi:L-lysine 6-transaminase
MTTISLPEATVEPHDVHDVLRRHLLVDGFDLVLDLEASAGSRLVDARDGTAYLDLFTFFASSALGMNHPALTGDPVFRDELLTAAMNKPSNSDVYSGEMARFVATFARVLGDPGLPHLFFVEGGALAVENALKVAFDWKSRWNEARGIDPSLGTKVLHLRDAFHGRSGYTMSLTNTDPVKTARFPKFAWPRIPSPYLTSTPPTSSSASARRWRRRGPRSSSTRTTSPASSRSRSRARAATTTSGRSSSRPWRRCAAGTTPCSCSTRCSPAAA